MQCLIIMDYRKMRRLLLVMDIEMLEAVGTGVAMGNAIDEVKARADVICKSVEEDGVYHYCLEKKLIKC